MAHIVGFTIEGLAGQPKPVSCVLNRDVNVFFGLNGSGKTTLLKILYSALSTDTDPLKGLPFERAKVEIYSKHYEKTFTRSFKHEEPTDSAKELTPQRIANISRFVLAESKGSKKSDLFDPKAMSDFMFRLKDGPKWVTEGALSDGEVIHAFEAAFLPISRLYRDFTASTGAARLSDKELDNAFALGLQAQWTKYYADVARQITQVQERGFANILGLFLTGAPREDKAVEAPSADEAYDRIKGFFNRQAGFTHLLRSRKEFLRIYKARPDLRNVVKQVERVENQIVEISAPRERFRQVLDSMFAGSKHLVFTEKEIQVELGDDRRIGLSLLSSGEKQLVFIALQALTGGPNSLLVDEPELSMHVDWQKKLVSTLTALNPETQLIMATHSPEILADLPDDRIFQL